ncbi:hypothetical protein D1AOALGA4SA_7389 [Olavius algarvensis Delta 1 endosymbiont]|nr:hypothetical protein D1AOALGA4SA_7389 [Olavius algarvensis Delta 1 endosymbiont]
MSCFQNRGRTRFKFPVLELNRCSGGVYPRHELSGYQR